METTSSSFARREEEEEGDKNPEAAAAASLERAAVNRVVHAMREYHRSCDREIERRKRNGRKAIAMMRTKNEKKKEKDDEEEEEAFVASSSSDDDTKIVGKTGTMKTTTKKKKNKKKRNLWLNWKALERVYEDHDRKSRESVAKNQRVFDALLATFSNAEHVPEHLRVRSDFSNVPAEKERPPSPARQLKPRSVVRVEKLSQRLVGRRERRAGKEPPRVGETLERRCFQRTVIEDRSDV